MRVRDLISFVAFAAIVAICIGYLSSLGVRLGAPSDRTDLSMDVQDINNLVVGSNVLLRGVPVGKVRTIITDSGSATIDFYVEGRYAVPADTDVRLENLSALGESYIGLIPRSETGRPLHDGEHIANARITQPASISELATSVVRVLKQLDPEALQRMVDEVDVALPDPAVVLDNLSNASVLIRNVALNMNGHGRMLLSNFQTLLQNATWVGPAFADIGPPLAEAGRGMGLALDVLGKDVHNGTAPEKFINLHRYLDRIQGLLDTRGGDLKIIGEAMEPQLSGIAGALMNFDSGQILSNVLAAVPEDGAITLRVAIPDK